MVDEVVWNIIVMTPTCRNDCRDPCKRIDLGKSLRKYLLLLSGSSQSFILGLTRSRTYTCQFIDVELDFFPNSVAPIPTPRRNFRFVGVRQRKCH